MDDEQMEMRRNARSAYGLSHDEAVQYIMERTYNQKNHNRAMAEINKQNNKGEK